MNFRSFSEPLAERLAASETGSSLYWLGQAGFAIATSDLRILIDPYLSDYFAQKYANSPYSHARMMPPPLHPEELRQLDFILCTHRHGDHMDPEALPQLANRNSGCKVVVPAAELSYAKELGISPSQLIPVDAGNSINLHPQLRIYPIPAAHERHEQDASGSHHFLGYIAEVP